MRNGNGEHLQKQTKVSKKEEVKEETGAYFSGTGRKGFKINGFVVRARGLGGICCASKRMFWASIVEHHEKNHDVGRNLSGRRVCGRG